MIGYKNYLSSLLWAILAIVTGVVMIATRADAMVLAVKIIACIFLFLGVVSLIVALRAGGEGVRYMGCAGGFAFLIAFIMFFYPEATARFLMFFIGLSLAGSAIVQFMNLYSIRESVSVSFTTYLFPLISVALGALLMFAPSILGEAIGFVAGGALVFYGISEIFAVWKMKKSGRKDDIIDVDYTKVDEQ